MAQMGKVQFRAQVGYSLPEIVPISTFLDFFVKKIYPHTLRYCMSC